MTRSSTAPRVVVIGGGIAGLAAATILAERGVAVTVRESQASFGGRLRAWPVTLPDGTTLHMERGFHAFFRQYYNLRALMRRWDPTLASLRPLVDYPILGPDGVRMRFDGLPKTSPWNIAAVAMRGGRWFARTNTSQTAAGGSWLSRMKGLAGIDIGQALLMLAWDERLWGKIDHLSAAQFLDGLRFPPEARRMLFDVFAHSFFNPEDDMSAAELLMMFHFYFTGNPEGLVFDVLRDAFEPAFVCPWTAHLERLGATLHASSPVSELTRDGAGFRVDGERADGVVVATDVGGLHALAAHSDVFAPVDRAKLASLALTAPFVVQRLWLDRPTANREPFVGTAGLGKLDNISCFHTFEGESAAWAAKTGGSIVELHAYGLPTDRHGELDEAALRAELVGHLHTLYPETREARILHEEWLVRRDCPAFAPGSRALRPGVETATPGLALAGDFVALPFPSALMERAATSGILAANTLLDAVRADDRRPEPIQTIPRRGLFAPLAGLLAR